MPKAQKYVKSRSEAMKAYWAKKKAKKHGKSEKLGQAAISAVELEQEGIWDAVGNRFVEKAETPPSKSYRVKVDDFAYGVNLDLEIKGVPDNLSSYDRQRLSHLISLVCRLQSV